MTTSILKLYVTGQTPQSERVIANLKLLCEHQLLGEYQLVIIDVLEFPKLAEEAKIIATPTLIKEMPPPLRRLIGDLSDATEVLNGLGLPRSGAPTTGSQADRARDDTP